MIKLQNVHNTSTVQYGLRSTFTHRNCNVALSGVVATVVGIYLYTLSGIVRNITLTLNLRAICKDVSMAIVHPLYNEANIHLSYRPNTVMFPGGSPWGRLVASSFPIGGFDLAAPMVLLFSVVARELVCWGEWSIFPISPINSYFHKV